MRKIASLFTVLMLLCALAFGQTRKVTGTVRDENGNPIPYASVTIAGTQTGTTADANGNYSIDLKQNSKLTFTATGFQTLTVSPNGNSFNLSLKRGESNLQEVVVTTALGLRRNKNTLPYAAQTIKGEDVSQTRSNNFVSGLSGKVSGVEIRQGNAMGASTLFCGHHYNTICSTGAI